MMQRIFVVLLLSLFTLTAAALPKNIFPEVDGWKKTDEIRTFSRDNLWDFINGGADMYLQYNFKQLHVAEYMHTDSTLFTVEVYQHESPQDAYGIYTSERPKELKLLPIGDEAYFETGILNFLADEYYIKLRSHSKSKATQKAMKEVARKTAERLEPKEGFPPATQCFTDKHRKPGPVQYIARNFMGYEFLHHAYKAAYQKEEQQWEAFLITLPSKKECRSMLNAYLTFTKQETDKLKEGYHMLEDPYNGKVYLNWQGKYITGVYNASETVDARAHLPNFPECGE